MPGVHSNWLVGDVNYGGWGFFPFYMNSQSFQKYLKGISFSTLKYCGVLIENHFDHTSMAFPFYSTYLFSFLANIIHSDYLLHFCRIQNSWVAVLSFSNWSVSFLCSISTVPDKKLVVRLTVVHLQVTFYLKHFILLLMGICFQFHWLFYFDFQGFHWDVPRCDFPCTYSVWGLLSP
jgi:hypothetical protein